ncbi:hypothetical protein AGMMS49983_11810 [Clostridia bacterium]|nr:hypothetical protein AGMMS49983_11810 [Clostridia bacterium]
MNIFGGLMNRIDRIEYAVVCDRGLHRDKNQDNFWCAGTYLASENAGLTQPLAGTAASKDFPVFAVFDGMGGETDGEKAAWLAACTFDGCAASRETRAGTAFLADACLRMNDAICDYAVKCHIRRIGTTAAILLASQSAVQICNLGDSRIFLHRKGRLEQLSEDHVANRSIGGKPPLTQFLGIPLSEFRIEPHQAKIKCRPGDRYLLCSDGLTDMVPEEKIASILSSETAALPAATALLEKALDAGGRDNITVILCDAVKA